MRRRSFIKTTVTASALFAFLPASACLRPDRKTGLILYTVREEMNSNPLETLDAIARTGYNWIEAADYSKGLFYGMKPSAFLKAVEDRGMKLISSHNSLNENNLGEVIDSAAEAGLKYIVMPSLPGRWVDSLDGFKRAADFLNIAGKRCSDSNIKLAFHNHTIEFKPIDGEIPYDLLVKNTDPELVTFEIDIAWITAAGHNPVQYFERYPGRFELWHVKDLSEEKRDATLGEGIIDFKPLFEIEKLSGMKYFFVEQDNCSTHTSLESVKISRDFLINKIF